MYYKDDELIYCSMHNILSFLSYSHTNNFFKFF